jgi:uncharacterized protein YjbI with pentapeptide repeats
MIAIFTVVSYIQQKQISEQHRREDAQLANLTRHKDITIAKEQREEDQRQADELHYQNVYNNYIEDVVNAIYKYQQENQSTFLSKHDKLSYISRKTIVASRQLNGNYRTQLFLFLYDNKLLPDVYSESTTISLDVADLSNVYVKQPPQVLQYSFQNILLNSMNLINISFIECHFENSTWFQHSIMNNSSFFLSYFLSSASSTNYHRFDAVLLDHSDFRKINLQQAKFMYSSVSYSNFSDAKLEYTLFLGTQLIYSDFSRVCFINVTFLNTNLTGAKINLTDEGIAEFNNVVFPNGTWFIHRSNLIHDGDAERNVSKHLCNHLL